MLLVSACLLGVNCSYNQKNHLTPMLWKHIEGKPVIMFCPEQAGGLTTPRLPSEIAGGCGQDVWSGKARVINSNGQDMTSAFLHGAKQCLRLSIKLNVRQAIFKSNSPSCGVNTIYDGFFNKSLKPGDGVCTALLRAHGVEVMSEKDLMQGGTIW